jgi:hypothetical protein
MYSFKLARWCLEHMTVANVFALVADPKQIPTTVNALAMWTGDNTPSGVACRLGIIPKRIHRTIRAIASPVWFASLAFFLLHPGASSSVPHF